MIALLHGKNTFLINQKASELRKKLQEELEKKKENYDTVRIDAASTDCNKIINEIETPSLFSPHKIITLKRPSTNPDWDKFQEYLIELAPKSKSLSNDLIVIEAKKLRSNSRLAKAFKKTGEVWASPEFNKRSFPKWAREQIAEADVKMDSQTVHLLSERVNYEPERLTREITKLSLLNKDAITEEDIAKVCPDTLEHSIWQLMDSINDGDVSQSERILSLMLRQGHEPFYILIMIARNLRITLLTKVLSGKGYSTREIASKLRVPPFTLHTTKKVARKTSINKIKTLYEKINNIDYSGKTGQLDVELALHILLSVI